MSTLVAQTISNGTVSTSSANVIQGSAKSWVNFNGVSGVSIRASYNVSSVTRNSAGDYTINFTNALPNADYSVAGTASAAATGDRAWVIKPVDVYAPTASTYRFTVIEAGSLGGILDSTRVCISIFD
jgi:hypothetical protein